jgi:GT2 family glycosyltransferase
MAETNTDGFWVVIPTYNRARDLMECLESLKIARVPLSQIIVVDNHSTDDTQNEVQKKFPEVVLIALDDNYGATGASNVGFKKALDQGAVYILRLDSDTVVAEDFLFPLLNAANNFPEVGIISPKIYYFNSKDEIWFAGADAHPWHFGTINDHRHEKDNPGNSQYREMDYAWGAAMLIKRAVLEQSKGFDTSFFVYYEEVDFCTRVRKLGFKIAYVPESHIWHKVGSITHSGWSAYHWNRSKLLLYRKHARNFFHRWLLTLYAFTYAIISPLFKGQTGNRGPLKDALRGFQDGWKIKIDQNNSSL